MEISENTRLLKLTWPIFIESLLAVLIGNMDAVMLSHYSENAVGAIGNANQLLGLLVVALNIIASATGIVVAQYLGAKKYSDINKIYSVAFFFNLILSVILSLSLLLFCDPILSILNIPQQMYADSKRYLMLVGGFLFLQGCLNVFAQIARSNGHTKYGMYVAIIINILNISLNYLFLYGPLEKLGFGANGVAVGTVLSRSIGLGIFIYIFIKHIDGEISVRYLRPFPKDMLTKMLRIGLPSTGENISYSLSQLAMLSFINTMGPIAVNVRVYSWLLSSFAWLFSGSISSATVIVVGHLVGSGNYDAAYKRVVKTLPAAISFSLIITITMYIFSPIAFGIFTDNPKVLALGATVLFVDIFVNIGRSVNLLVIQSMRAAGDVAFPTIMGVLSMWGIAVLFAYILGVRLGWGIMGVWVAMAMDEWLRSIISLIRWKMGGWRGKRVV